MNIQDLSKKYPNDTDLGKAVRHLAQIEKQASCENDIKTSLQMMSEKSMPTLIVLKMEFKPSPEFVQGLHHNTLGEVDTLFDIFEQELKKLRLESNDTSRSI